MGIIKTKPNITLICSYSIDRCAYVKILCSQFLHSFPFGNILLWSYDKLCPDLKPWTLGVGPGSRLVNLKKLMKASGQPDYFIISDDDAYLTSGTFMDLISSFKMHPDLIIVAPSMDSRGFWNFAITKRRFPKKLRRDGFVEIGPIIVCANTSSVNLFPDKYGPRGVGLEWYWTYELDLTDRLAINHKVTMMHAQKPTSTPPPIESEFLSNLIESHNSEGFPPSLTIFRRGMIKFIGTSKRLFSFFLLTRCNLSRLVLGNPERIYTLSIRKIFWLLECDHIILKSPLAMILTKKCIICNKKSRKIKI